MRVAEAFSVPRGARLSRPAAGGPVFRLPPFQAVAASSCAPLLACHPPSSAVIRRRETLRTGRGLVEALERLKLAMLEGAGGAGQIESLQRQLDAASGATSGDAALDDIVDAVRLRAEVEIAKRRGRG